MYRIFIRSSLLSLVIAVSVNADESARNAPWAFRVLSPVPVPRIGNVARVRSTIDRFILSKLEAKRLSLSPDAGRATLARRTWLDLVGLPPSPQAVDAILSDHSPDAHERMVDRLLAAPAFGQRWARHWLDVVGYMDTTGFDQDANLVLVPQGKWRYRHYVIDAFNKDKPYDRFVREQLAGDELVDWRNAERYTDEIRESLIATGFLRTAADFTHEPESFIKLNMFEVLHDTIEIVNTSLLGITMHCSRCHDHKFDPLTQVDYYRMMSCLTPAYNPENWKAVYPWNPDIVQRGMLDVAPAERTAIEQNNKDIDTKIAAFKQRIADVNRRARETVLETKLAVDRKQFDTLRKSYPAEPVHQGLSLWLRADADVFADSEGKTLAPLGTTVGSWKDQIFGDNLDANDVIQTHKNRRPTLVDGFGIANSQALRFDGAVTHLRTPDHPTLRPQSGLTVFVVYKLNKIPTGDRTLVAKYAEDGISHGNWGTDLFHQPEQPANRARIYFGDPQKPGDYGGGQAGSHSLSDLLPHQLTFVYDQGKTTIRVDQQAEQTQAAGPKPPAPAIDAKETVELLVGARITGPEDGETVLPGDIAEVLFYRKALDTGQIAHVEKYLERKYGRSNPGMRVSDDELAAALGEEGRSSLDRLQNQIVKLNTQRKTWGRLQALYDVGPPPVTRLLEGGSYLSPGEVVEPGFIGVLSRPDRDVIGTTVRPGSSGRRTALANWMTDPEGPAGALLARVMMNRMWQHVFGEGLVPTSENLGVNGAQSTHPALLEHLSGEFVHAGWGIKKMLRALVTSTVYRQSSTGQVAPDHPDPTNQLLWRMRMRRLDAEVIRDSILAATGRLDRTMGGKPIPVKASADGSVTVDTGQLESPSAGHRRSIYLMHRRNYNLSMLSTFDQPLIATTCSRRNPAAVVSQSLMMLNDQFLFDQSQALAERVWENTDASPEHRIKTLFRLVLARLPNENELALCKEALEDQKPKFRDNAEHHAFVQLCHTLFNTSEFLYAE